MKKKTKAPITSSLFRLIGYRNSNYARNLENKKSGIEYCYFINREVVSWYSKKQKIVSKSIIQAKYITFGYIAQEVIWLRCFINKLPVFKPINYITLYKDYKTSFILTNNIKS